MPEQSGMNELFARFGNELNQGHAAHKADSTKYSEFGDLPGGIDNGVAQLVEMKLTKIKADAKANAGQWMFYAAGVVHRPVYHVDAKTGEKILIKGLRTKIQEVIAPTPDKQGAKARKTVQDHVDWIYNELRKLGVDTSKLSSFKDVEPVMAAMKKKAPFFRFRTWKGEPATEGPYAGKEPMTNEFWNGACEDPGKDTSNTAGATPPAATPHSGTTDNSAKSTPPAAPPPTTQADSNPDGAADEPQTASSSGEGPTEAEVIVWGEAAVNGDDSASDKLREIAYKQGYTEAQVDDAESWSHVAALVVAKLGAAPDEAAAEEAAEAPPAAPVAPAASPTTPEWKPVKDDIYMYQVKDAAGNPVKNPKTKRAADPVECIVTKVNLKSRTVDLKNNTNKKDEYKGIAWDALEDGQ